jgi:hypothetical protein
MRERFELGPGRIHSAAIPCTGVENESGTHRLRAALGSRSAQGVYPVVGAEGSARGTPIARSEAAFCRTAPPGARAAVQLRFAAKRPELAERAATVHYTGRVRRPALLWWSRGSSTLTAFDLQIIYGRNHPAAGIQDKVEEDPDQQIATGPFTDESKRTDRVNARGKRSLEPEVIHRRDMVAKATRQTPPLQPLVIEVAHHTAVGLLVRDQVKRAGDFDILIIAVVRPNEM